jgi:hypothetical protein
MKTIQKEELFGNLSSFLKTKGVELKEGSYTQAVEKSCGILADVINLTQQGVDRAKTKIDKRLDQMRQVIHEKTAPKTPPPAQAAAPAQAPAAQPPVEEAPKAATATRKPRVAKKTKPAAKKKK